MKAPVIVLGFAFLLMGATAQAKNSIVFQPTQLAAADAQVATAAQTLMTINVMEKVDFAKEDNLRQSSHVSCKTNYMPYGNPGYISICKMNMQSDRSTFQVVARMIARGTKKGAKEQARFGTAMPTEMKIEFFKQCMTPHLTITNSSNNAVLVNEVGGNCENLTTDIGN